MNHLRIQCYGADQPCIVNANVCESQQPTGNGQFAHDNMSGNQLPSSRQKQIADINNACPETSETTVRMCTSYVFK